MGSSPTFDLYDCEIKSHNLMLYSRGVKDQERPLFFVGHSYGGTIISWVCYYHFQRITYVLICGRSLMSCRPRKMADRPMVMF